MIKTNKLLFFTAGTFILGCIFSNGFASKSMIPAEAASDDVFNFSGAEMSGESTSSHFNESHHLENSGEAHYIFKCSYSYDDSYADFTFDIFNVSIQVNRNGSVSYDYKVSIENVAIKEDMIYLGIPSIDFETYTMFKEDDSFVTNYYEPFSLCNYPDKNIVYSGTITQNTVRPGKTHGETANKFVLEVKPYIDSEVEMCVDFEYELSSYHGNVGGNSNGKIVVGIVFGSTVLGAATVIGIFLATKAAQSGKVAFSTPGISYDSAGDIKVVDPVNGNETIYVKNKDGTYTNPLTNVKVSKEELEAIQASRYENLETLKNEQAKDDAFNQKAHEDNSKASDASDYNKKKEEIAREEYIDKLKEEHHLSDDVKEDVLKNELKHEQEINEIKSEQNLAEAQELTDAIETNEKIVEAADDFFAAVENDPSGVGKAGSAIYKSTKAVASTLAEKGVSSETVLEATIKAGTEAATTMSDSSLEKIAVTFVGTTASETVAGLSEGKELEDALSSASDKGLAEAAYTAVSEAADKVIPQDSVSKGIKGVADTEYHNQVVEPGIEEALDKGSK